MTKIELFNKILTESQHQIVDFVESGQSISHFENKMYNDGFDDGQYYVFAKDYYENE